MRRTDYRNGGGSSCVGGGHSLIKVNDVIQQHAAELMYRRDRPPASGDAARLARIRYLAVLFVGAVLLALIAQMLLNGGTLTFKGVLQIGLIGVLAPGVVFFVNQEELRLRRKLEHQTVQLQQRKREVFALNRMAQSHLADCQMQVPVIQSGAQGYRGLDEPKGIGPRLELEDENLRLKINTNGSDRGSLEAVANGQRNSVSNV